MLLGYKPLPWEANPNLLFQVIHSATACRLIRHLLRWEALEDPMMLTAPSLAIP